MCFHHFNRIKDAADKHIIRRISRITGSKQKCKIIEKNETIFEVRTFAGSRERAKKIVDNWNKNASKIYPKILDLLLED